MTASETYLHSWEKELKETLKQTETRQKHYEESLKKIQKHLQEQTQQRKTLEDNLYLITDQMKTTLESYRDTIVKRLETLDHTKDLKIQGEVLFTVFKTLYEEACLFFSRNQFQVLSSPLQESKELNLRDLWNSYWKETPSKLEDEHWLSYKNSLWSLKVYHQDLVDQLMALEKEVTTQQEKENVVLQQKKKVDGEITLLQHQLGELSIFSEKMKQMSTPPEVVTGGSRLLDPPELLQKTPAKHLSPIPEVETTDTEE